MHKKRAYICQISTPYHNVLWKMQSSSSRAGGCNQTTLHSTIHGVRARPEGLFWKVSLPYQWAAIGHLKTNL